MEQLSLNTSLCNLIIYGHNQTEKEYWKAYKSWFSETSKVIEDYHHRRQEIQYESRESFEPITEAHKEVKKTSNEKQDNQMAMTDELKDTAQINWDIHVLNIDLPLQVYELQEQAQASIPKLKFLDEDGKELNPEKKKTKTQLDPNKRLNAEDRQIILENDFKMQSQLFRETKREVQEYNKKLAHLVNN